MDIKDKKGSQTALYMAVKAGLGEAARLLIQNGADLDIVCYGKTIAKHIEVNMPGLNPDSIPRLREVNNPNCDNSMERIRHNFFYTEYY